MAIITGLALGAGALALGGTAATAATVAGVGIAAGGAYQASKQRKDMAEYNRDVALTNQEISIQNARDVELRGRQAIYDQRRAVRRQLGSVRAGTAASGLEVDVAGTTPADLVTAMVEAGELDVMRLRNNIELEERRALVQGTSYAAQAGQFELQREGENPFRSALAAGAGAATGGRNADILFGG